MHLRSRSRTTWRASCCSGSRKWEPGNLGDEPSAGAVGRPTGATRPPPDSHDVLVVWGLWRGVQGSARRQGRVHGGRSSLFGATENATAHRLSSWRSRRCPRGDQNIAVEDVRHGCFCRWVISYVHSRIERAGSAGESGRLPRAGGAAGPGVVRAWARCDVHSGTPQTRLHDGVFTEGRSSALVKIDPRRSPAICLRPRWPAAEPSLALRRPWRFSQTIKRLDGRRRPLSSAAASSAALVDLSSRTRGPLSTTLGAERQHPLPRRSILVSIPS